MNRKPLALPFFVLAFALATPLTRANGHSQTVQSRCNEMSSKILLGELRSGVKYVLPRLVELVGGPEQAMNMLKKNVTDKGAAMGMKIICLAPTQFSQVGVNSFALIPTMTVTSGVKGGRRGQLTIEGSTLGVSIDHGVTWHFLDLHGDEAIPETLIPGGIGSIKPPPKPPGIFKAE